MSFYPDIFLEAAHTASVIPLGTEPTFFAMHAFGQDMFVAAMVAVIGGACGAVFNFALGNLLRKKYLSIEGTKFLSLAQYAKGKQIFSRVGFLFLLFSWMPLLNFAVFAAGFFGMHKKFALPLLVVGLAGRYGYYAFH